MTINRSYEKIFIGFQFAADDNLRTKDVEDLSKKRGVGFING
jgi:hypothetical protein